MRERSRSERYALQLLRDYGVDHFEDMTMGQLDASLADVQSMATGVPPAERDEFEALEDYIAAEIKRRKESAAQQDRADGLALAAAALAEGTADGELMVAAAADCIDAALALVVHDWSERQALKKVRAALAECSAGAGLALGA